jgi:hypothetical protein
MRWILKIVAVVTVLLTALLSGQPLCAQEQAAKSKILPDVSPEQFTAANELRNAAGHELFADEAGYEAPDIATPLTDPHSFIAIVRIVSVKFPAEPNVPYSLVSLHVEQLLRGVSDQTELQAISRWAPRPPPYSRVISGGPRETTFDLTEPKVGNRYLVGYPFMDVDKGKAYISGAIDLDDHDQAQLVPNVQRFLGMEAAVADSSNFAPFVSALSDQLPWFRDLAASRLVGLATCYTSPVCQEALLAAARNLLDSKKLADRWEALKWLEQVSQDPNGSPWMFSSSGRELLVSAGSDTNLWIADEAYRQLELLDFFHSAKPGECTAIFPALRKSTRWAAHEADGVSITGPYSLACIPARPEASSDQE